MPDTFLIATDAPVGEHVGGQYVEFPCLLVDDLLPWCAELKAQWRKVGEARLRGQKMADFDRWRAQKYLDDTDPTLDDLTARVRTPAGAKRVLLLSLKKAGKSDEEAAAIAAAVPAFRLGDLAVAVSRLMPPPDVLANIGGGGAGPNEAAGGEAGGEQTGST